MFPLKVKATLIFTLVKSGFPMRIIFRVDVSKVNVTHSSTVLLRQINIIYLFTFVLFCLANIKYQLSINFIAKIKIYMEASIISGFLKCGRYFSRNTVSVFMLFYNWDKLNTLDEMSNVLFFPWILYEMRF